MAGPDRGGAGLRLSFPARVRHILYATDAVEALNSKLRRAGAPEAVSRPVRSP